jgi:DNA modification methylase
MKAEQVAIADLMPDPRNARRHPKRNVDAIAASLKQFGQQKPIVVGPDGHVVAGNGTLEAAISLGWTEIAIVRTELDGIDASAFAVADNRSAELASWSDELADVLREVTDGGVPTEALGFSDAEMRNLMVAAVNAPSLSERFLVPPFSVLDARQGYWQERKRRWIGLGIKSEIGRLESGFNAPQGRGNTTGKSSAMNRLSGRLARDADSDDPIVSIFDPVLCELVYRWFSSLGDVILDPFAGGSVRGIVAALLGRKYFGIDLSRRQIEANREQAKAIVRSAEVMPSWLVGDSKDLAALASGVEADLIFSCPPYGDLERYSDDKRDLSVMEQGEFLSAYRQIIAASAGALKSDRFACFVVSEYRDASGVYTNFVGETIAAFEVAGCRYYNEAVLVTAIGSLPLRVSKMFKASRKLGKTHQNVLVFCKGDPRAAAEACGEIEVGDVPHCDNAAVMVPDGE